MSLADLPVVNASLNGLSAVFLSAGYYFIRRKNQVSHRNCMIAAFVTSTLFLACYLTYHGYLAYHLHRGPTVQGPGLVPANLFGDPPDAHRLGSGDCAAGDDHASARAAAALRASQADRPLDLAVLDVCLRDRRADLPAALPDLPPEMNRQPPAAGYSIGLRLRSASRTWAARS